MICMNTYPILGDRKDRVGSPGGWTNWIEKREKKDETYNEERGNENKWEHMQG